ncbi:MAG: hypothetical protein ACOX3R_08695 [Desulfitobacteriia bacterium]
MKNYKEIKSEAFLFQFIFFILFGIFIFLVGCTVEQSTEGKHAGQGIGNLEKEKPGTSSVAEKDFYIMTAYDNGPIGCEYGINRDDQMDMEQMLEELEQLSGFIFYESQMTGSKLFGDELYEGIHLKFDFLKKEPEKIEVQYTIDDKIDQIYTVNDYPIKVPTEPGVYNYFAKLNWNSEDKETVFFRVTIKKDL